MQRAAQPSLHMRATFVPRLAPPRRPTALLHGTAQLYGTSPLAVPKQASPPPPTALLPVTVLSGFLGAGKTTLLRHLLSHAQGKRIAVLVNDMAAVNIDEALIADKVRFSGGEQLLALSNGCICCSIREDLVREVRGLAAQRRFDCLIVESTGVSLPLPVAATFGLPAERAGTSSEGEGLATAGLSDVARLDSLVTVVDAERFVSNVLEAASLQDEGIAVDEDDDRSVADLLIEQVEFADLLVLNKVDLVTPAQADQLEALLRRLNIKAKVLRADHGRVPVDEVLGTRAFDLESAQQAPGWLAEISRFEAELAHSHGAPYGAAEDAAIGSHSNSHPPRPHTAEDAALGGHAHSHGHGTDAAGHAHTRGLADAGAEGRRRGASLSSPAGPSSDARVTEAERFGISSFVYFARRPFHPGRLLGTALSVTWKGVLRSKGFFWLATRHDVMGIWQSAGGSWQGEPGGVWIAAQPEAEMDPSELPSWDPTWGDRCQQIVWIGMDMDQAALTGMLDACLLTDAEMRLGPAGWAEAFEDSLPEWGMAEELVEAGE